MENGKDLSVNRNLVKFSKICVNDLMNYLIFKITHFSVNWSQLLCVEYIERKRDIYFGVIKKTGLCKGLDCGDFWIVDNLLIICSTGWCRLAALVRKMPLQDKSWLMMCMQWGLADPNKAASLPWNREVEGLCGEAGGDPLCVGILITPEPTMGLSRTCSRGTVPILFPWQTRRGKSGSIHGSSSTCQLVEEFFYAPEHYSRSLWLPKLPWINWSRHLMPVIPLWEGLPYTWHDPCKGVKAD